MCWLWFGNHLCCQIFCRWCFRNNFLPSTLALKQTRYLRQQHLQEIVWSMKIFKLILWWAGIKAIFWDAAAATLLNVNKLCVSFICLTSIVVVSSLNAEQVAFMVISIREISYIFFLVPEWKKSAIFWERGRIQLKVRLSLKNLEKIKRRKIICPHWDSNPWPLALYLELWVWTPIVKNFIDDSFVKCFICGQIFYISDHFSKFLCVFTLKNGKDLAIE